MTVGEVESAELGQSLQLAHGMAVVSRCAIGLVSDQATLTAESDQFESCVLLALQTADMRASQMAVHDRLQPQRSG